MYPIEYLLLGAGGHAKVVISIITNFGGNQIFMLLILI